MNHIRATGKIFLSESPFLYSMFNCNVLRFLTVICHHVLVSSLLLLFSLNSLLAEILVHFIGLQLFSQYS